MRGQVKSILTSKRDKSMIKPSVAIERGKYETATSVAPMDDERGPGSRNRQMTLAILSIDNGKDL